MTRTVALASGGLESSVGLAWMQSLGRDLTPLHINYGQKAGQVEFQHLVNLCERLGIADRLKVLSLFEVSMDVMQSSSLVHPDIKLPRGLDQTLTSTYVPQRNLLFLTMAAAWVEDQQLLAQEFSPCDIALFTNPAEYGDREVSHPDGSQEFATAVTELLRVTSPLPHPPRVIVPMAHMTKHDVAVLGESLGVNPSESYSCYQGADPPCGECASCLERDAALASIHFVNTL